MGTRLLSYASYRGDLRRFRTWGHWFSLPQPFPNDRIELVFVAYQGKQTQLFSVFLCIVFAVLWPAAIPRLLEQKLTGRLKCIAILWGVMSAMFLYSGYMLCKTREHYNHEKVKANLVFFNLLGITAGLILLNPGELGAGAEPLASCIITGWLIYFIQVRRVTSRVLYAHSLLVLAVVHAARSVLRCRSGAPFQWHAVACDLLIHSVAGVLLPALLGVRSEERARSVFLQRLELDWRRQEEQERAAAELQAQCQEQEQESRQQSSGGSPRISCAAEKPRAVEAG